MYQTKSSKPKSQRTIFIHLRLARIAIPLVFAAVAALAALWAAPSGPGSTAEAAGPSALTVGIDFGTSSGAASLYDINNLPPLEDCIDVKTNVNSGFFYLDVFILNTNLLYAFNADFAFTANRMTVLESKVDHLFGTSSSLVNVSRNTDATGTVSPAVTDGFFSSGAVDTGSNVSGSGVLARIKAQATIIAGGHVIDFAISTTPTRGVTLTAEPGNSHPGDTNGDGLFDGSIINATGKIAVDRPDSDGDSVSSDCDNCPSTPNVSQTDTDLDGLGDACDPDDDNDGVPDPSDNCPLVYNPSQDPTACTDTDGDGVLNGLDNCPGTPNANQTDSDGDGTGDACDPDDDNDGVPDVTDNCDFTPNPGQGDFNSNGTGDACEDSDGDLYLDDVDNCPSTPNGGQADSDSDGLGDACDNCPDNANADQGDWNTDGVGDACQNSDGDPAMDDLEVWVGTDPTASCALTPGFADELIDGTPYDNNDDQKVTLSDALRYSPSFLSKVGDTNWDQRYDLTMDLRVSLGDVLNLVVGGWLTSCAP